LPRSQKEKTKKEGKKKKGKKGKKKKKNLQARKAAITSRSTQTRATTPIDGDLVPETPNTKMTKQGEKKKMLAATMTTVESPKNT